MSLIQDRHTLHVHDVETGYWTVHGHSQCADIGLVWCLCFCFKAMLSQHTSGHAQRTLTSLCVCGWVCVCVTDSSVSVVYSQYREVSQRPIAPHQTATLFLLLFIYCSLYSTIFYSTELQCSLLRLLLSTLLYSSVHYSAVLHSPQLSSALFCSTRLYCTQLYCTLLHSTVLYSVCQLR